MEKFKKVIILIIDHIKKEQAGPVLVWTVLLFFGLALVFSFVWLWPAGVLGIIAAALARRSQLNSYKKTVN